VLKKIYITGIGIISALGGCADETRDALLQGKSGIAPIAYLQSKYKGILPAGEVKFTNQELAVKLNLQSIKSFSRTALLGMMAAQQAWETSSNPNLRTGLISSTSVGGIDKSEIAYKKYLENHELDGLLHQLISHDCGDSTERIADYLNIRGFVSTISTACSSSSNAMILGARMIQGGMLDKVLVGGTDALTIYTLNGFNTLKILDDAWCRPFDSARKGLNLGEGAAYLTLESEQSVRENESTVLCELSGYGNTNDAFHQTASSPDGAGAYHAMKLALKKANLKTGDIDYINAHGTATPNNDLSEGLAIKNLFGDYLPRFSSTKSFTGHTLAAAGSIEAVISILMMKNRMLAPNLNFTHPIEELSMTPIIKLQENVDIHTVLSNSFGFGGNCSSLIFSQPA
jgi:3-oxoacyl-[acyl-carrier-protein] synthase-1